MHNPLYYRINKPISKPDATDNSHDANPILKQMAQNVQFIILDLEMTGGNPKQNSILEIYALKYPHQSNTKDHFHQLVKPNHPISGMLRRITGIHPKMVASAPSIHKVMKPFMDFVGPHSVFVAHNVSCDLKFIHYYAQKILGYTPQNFAVCTHLLSEKLFSESQKMSLKGLCEHLGLPVSKAHRAQNDALMTAALFSHILQKLGEMKLTTLESILRYQGDTDTLKRLGWHLSADAIQQAPSSAGIFHLYNQDDELVMWGRGIHLRTHLKELKTSPTIKRSQYRKMMSAAKLTTIPTPHFLDALLYPLSRQSNHPAKLKQPLPLEHSRPYLNVFMDENDQAYITIAKPSLSAAALFGPISHRITAKKHLDSMAFLSSTQHSKETRWTLKTSSSFDLSRYGLSWVHQLLLREPFSLRSIKRQIRRHQHPQWHDVSSLWGFLIAKIHMTESSDSLLSSSSSSTAIKIYPLMASQLVDPIATDISWQKWHDTPEAKQFIRHINILRRTQNSPKHFHHQTQTSLKIPQSRERLAMGLWGYEQSRTHTHGLTFRPLT